MTQISYQLTALLNEGAIYKVFRGLAYLPDGETREVLVKQLQPHIIQDPVVLSHLAGFSDVARGLQHPNLAPLWDLGQHNGLYYYIREFLPGCSLEHLLPLIQSEAAILSPAMAVYITQEVSEAIAALHRYRVPGDQPIYLFHGGLSPENIVLTRTGGVVVTDAGLDVIFWRNPEIQAWLRERKGPYQPPEYSSGQRPMRRGDAFSISAVLYHMLMGRPLWEVSPHWYDSLQMTLPSQHHHRVTEQFDEILQETLHPNQEHRQVQVDQLRQDLTRSGLLRQAKADRREATAYIEALVSQALQHPPHESLVEIQPPFHLESLLPDRPELVPPHKRYQPPQYDATSSFHPKHEESNDEATNPGVMMPAPTPMEEFQDDQELLHSQTNSPPTQANATHPSDPSEEVLDELGLDSLLPPAPLGTPNHEEPGEDRTSIASIPSEPLNTGLTLGDLLESDNAMNPDPVEATMPPASPPLPGQRFEHNNSASGHRPPPPPAMETVLPPAEVTKDLDESDSFPPELTTPGIAADLGVMTPPEPIEQKTSDIPDILSSSPVGDSSLHHLMDDIEEDNNMESTLVGSVPPPPEAIPEIDSDEIIPLSASMELMPDDVAPLEELMDTGPDIPLPQINNITPAHLDAPSQEDFQPATIDLPNSQIPQVSDTLFPSVLNHMAPTPETMALPIEDINGYPGMLSSPPPGLTPPANFPTGSIASASAPPMPVVQETVALPLEQITGNQPPPNLSGPPPPPMTFGADDGLERFGNFVLLNRVAFGGMAEVFRAKLEGHVGFQRIVAVKRILPEYSEDPTFIQMFTDEARIAGSLTHPHIVQINELGEVEGIYYISMEFIDGIDLARVIKIRRTLQQPIPLGIVLDVAIPVCKALHYAHTALDPNNNPLNMIHRDVTPHNILISKKGEIKLTDFGIAKASQNIAQTAVGELKGKLSYMSPEQAEGKPLDQRTDLFQVGIVLYEMLTLRKMFEGNSDQSVLHKIQNSTYPKPRQISTAIPEVMEKITMRALAVNSKDRYQTAEEMERDLVQLRNNLPPHERNADISIFTQQILEQRDFLLAEMAANRGKPRPMALNNAPHLNNQPQAAPSEAPPMDFGQLQSPGPGTETRHEQAESKKTAIVSSVIVFIMLIVGGVVGFFFLKGPPPPPPKASFSVQTRPSGAEVRLDGEKVGVTPLRTTIPFDRLGHVLQLVKRGYRPFNHKFKLQHVGDEVDLFLRLSPNRRKRRKRR